MREWSYRPGETALLTTLSADARRSPHTYTNDQIWELALGRGEPPCLGLETTFGVRARSMRLFPRFSQGDEWISDPATFSEPPLVRQFGPGYLQLHYSPLAGLKVISDYYAVDSQSIAGRFKLKNSGAQKLRLRLEWAAQLAPLPGGERMSALEIDNVFALTGRSDNLNPVVLLGGGAEPASGVFPALVIQLELEPGASHTLPWAIAALEETTASFNKARALIQHNPEAELAHLEMLDAGLVSIHTGNPDWDRAFALAQNVALGLLISPSEHLPDPSFVLARLPAHGYSPLQDGSDYSPLWSGQTALDTYRLCQYLLPAFPHLARGLLENLLSVQDTDGSIDWRPGAGGQRSHFNATPILAHLAWQIYQVTQERQFLAVNFPALYAFYLSWFSDARDRDRDGLPEWSNSLQTGLENHPRFSGWLPEAQGADITTIESPDLLAFLYSEASAMQRICGVLQETDIQQTIQKQAAELKKAVQKNWHAQAGYFRCMDRDSHQSCASQPVVCCQGDGNCELDVTLKPAQRLFIRIRCPDENIRRAEIHLSGSGPDGQPQSETLPPERLRWQPGFGRATSSQLFSHLSAIQIQGIESSDQVEVETVDHQRLDITNLLPLWAGLPDERQAKMMLQKAITNPKRFWKPYGLPLSGMLPAKAAPPDSDLWQTIAVWNILIGEGLLRYGYHDQAGELVKKLMNAICDSLRHEGAFRQSYHAESGQGSGERNTLTGLPPLGLFLKTIGVAIHNPYRVLVSGYNPFPWPVSVRYRGLTVMRQKDRTTVVFPGGETAHAHGAAPQLISLG